MTNRPITSAATAAQKAEETRQAIVLFAIVILFVCCHALRILLNVNELLTLEVVRASIKNGCFGVPFWALIGVAVSQFLLTVNSSVNFFIYCFMCTTFRKIFISYLKKVTSKHNRYVLWRSFIPNCARDLKKYKYFYLGRDSIFYFFGMM